MTVAECSGVLRIEVGIVLGLIEELRRDPKASIVLAMNDARITIHTSDYHFILLEHPGYMGFRGCKRGC